MDKQFTIGEKVRIAILPPYVKTAESMPMLRPPHVIKLGEEGTIAGCRPGNYWEVRFQKGVFLMDSQYIEPLESVGQNVDLEAIASQDLPVQ
ncbi:hypothetical protein BCD67_04290 [Oscillatoriales cyanobacterium USR001]|nr:hypothetical protein BCD67_04290 [Oscillatoriales cyanobacterium USR001]